MGFFYPLYCLYGYLIIPIGLMIKYIVEVFIIKYRKFRDARVCNLDTNDKEETETSELSAIISSNPIEEVRIDGVKAEYAQERMETFSDGIFAIAITLVAVNLRSPQFTPGNEIIQPLLHIWPEYVGQVVTFIIIGLQW